MPAARDGQPAPGLRASDAERDHVVARLRDEFVAGRLSQDTFMHRVDQVMGTRHQADLPVVLADLPAGTQPGSALSRWLRGAWSRVTGAAAGPPGPVRAPTSSMSAAPDRGQPFSLQFPRAGGELFTIGRDAGCDLAIADMTVSRQHAQLERAAGGWLLSDLESTNGTRVNGWLVRGQVPVKPGDLVSFGSLQVIFTELPGPPAEARRDSPG